MLFITAAMALTPLDCTDLDADLCAGVNTAALDVNAAFGFDLLTEDAPRARHRLSTLYTKLLEVRNLAVPGCEGGSFTGISSGRYVNHSATAVWREGQASGEVVATYGNGAFSATSTDLQYGTVGAGDDLGRYDGAGRIVGKRRATVDGTPAGTEEIGYHAGIWVRQAGKRGAVVSLWGNCNRGYTEQVFDDWFAQVDLTPPECPIEADILPVPNGDGGSPDGGSRFVDFDIVGNTCGSEGSIPVGGRSTAHYGTTYRFVGTAPGQYAFEVIANFDWRISFHDTCDSSAAQVNFPADDDRFEIILDLNQSVILSIGGDGDACGPYTIHVTEGPA